MNTLHNIERHMFGRYQAMGNTMAKALPLSHKQAHDKEN
jgi:hypothetical protein